MAHVSRLTEEMRTPSSFFSSSCSRVGSRKGKTLHWQCCVCMWTPGPLGLKRRHDWFWIMSLTKASLKELVPTQGLECWQGLWGTSSWGSSEETAGVLGVAEGWDAAEDGSELWYLHLGPHSLSKHLVLTCDNLRAGQRHDELTSFFMDTAGRVCPVALALQKEKVPREHLWHIIPWHS